MKLKRIWNYGAGALAASLSNKPRLSHVAAYITHRCNLRCTYCSSPYLKTAELSFGQWQKIFSELRSLGCQRVLLLGGEPLVRNDFDRMIDEIKKLGMQCVLTSNGLLVPRYIHRLTNLDTLVLSLDGIGKVNDFARGEGVFDAVVDAINAAREINIPVKLNAVMTCESAPGLDDLLEFTEARDLSLTVNVVRTGNTLWHEAQTVSQSDIETRALLNRLAAISRRNKRLLFSAQSFRFAAAWPDFAEDRLTASQLNGEKLRAQPKCHAGKTYLMINPDGATHPCAITANRINGGNVVTDGVKNAWHGLHKHDCVTCSSPCMLEQNYLFSGNPRVLARFARNYLMRFA